MKIWSRTGFEYFLWMAQHVRHIVPFPCGGCALIFGSHHCDCECVCVGKSRSRCAYGFCPFAVALKQNTTGEMRGGGAARAKALANSGSILTFTQSALAPAPSSKKQLQHQVSPQKYIRHLSFFILYSRVYAKPKTHLIYCFTILSVVYLITIFY